MEKTIKVTNKQGVHARPASLIVEEAGKYDCEIFLVKDNREINAKSILGLLTLAAIEGEELVIKVNGKNEKKEQIVINNLSKLFENNFYE
jgi:phosphocarrier protein